MSTETILIISIASIIGIAYLIKVRSYDIYEKESFIRLLIVAFVGGFLSIIIALFLYEPFEVRLNFIDAIIKIGLIEESSKLFALAILYFFIKNDFDEIVDGIIYITAISLGFAIIENISYCFRSEDPFMLLFQRSIFSVIGHISFSGYMGIAFYIHKKVRRNYIGLILSVILASVAHGFYDGVLFHRELNFLFQIVFIFLILIQFWILRSALGFSRFREKLTESTFKETDKTVFLFCSICDCSIKTKELSFWKIDGGKCDNCNNIVFDSQNVMRLFQYFRPILNLRKYFKKFIKAERLVTLDDKQKIFLNTKRNFLSANTTDLGDWLENRNERDKLRILKTPVLGLILRHLGLKYML